MPTYLCHGFRWHRRSIRVYVVVQNIDDAAPEWIIGPNSSFAILQSFYSLFDFIPEPGTRRRHSDEDRKQRRRNGSKPPPPPAHDELAVPAPTVPPEEDEVLQHDWSSVKLLEEYDLTDLHVVSRPYAYVADYAVRIDLSVSVTEEIARYEERMARDASDERAMAGSTSDEYGRPPHKKGSSAAKKPGWLEKLRDQLQRGEDIRWYVVVCDDEEREAPDNLPKPDPPREKGVLGGKELQRPAPGAQQGSFPTPTYQSGGLSATQESRPKTPKTSGLRRLFRKGDEGTP